MLAQSARSSARRFRDDSGLPAIVSVLLYPFVGGYQVGDVQQFRTEVYSAGRTRELDRPVVFSSSDTNVLTIDPVTGVAHCWMIGTATVTVSCGGKSASSVVTVYAANGEPVPVQETLAVTEADTPCAALRTITVTTQGQLAALCAPGAIQFDDKIVIDKTLIAAGNFVLPEPVGVGSGWVWITTNDESWLGSEGQCISAVASLPTIRSPNNLPAISFASYASRYRLRGLRVDLDPTVTTHTGGCVQVGDGSATTFAPLPDKIVVDRCIVSGENNLTTLDAQRGIQLNCRRAAVIDSRVPGWSSGVPNTFDAQAIASWAGTGPFLIRGNYLEGAAEGLLFGGADPSTTGLLPEDVQVIGNRIAKPLRWRTMDEVKEKNGFEMKHGRRFHWRANIIEHTWSDSQEGCGFVLWSNNQAGSETWSETRDVLIEYNWFKSIAEFGQLTATNEFVAVPMSRIRVQHNVVTGFGNNPDTYSVLGVAGRNRGFQLATTAALPGRDWKIEHNTAPIQGTDAWVRLIGATAIPGLVFRNNIGGGATYSIFCSEGDAAVVPSYFNNVGSNLAGNVIAGNASTWTGAATNYSPANFAGVGFIGGGTAALDKTAALADLALSGGSAFKGLATDGTDPGADIATVSSLVASVPS